MAVLAHLGDQDARLLAGVADEEAKLTTAKFFYQKLLHRTQSYAASIESGAESVMELDQDAFAF